MGKRTHNFVCPLIINFVGYIILRGTKTRTHALKLVEKKCSSPKKKNIENWGESHLKIVSLLVIRPSVCRGPQMFLPLLLSQYTIASNGALYAHYWKLGPAALAALGIIILENEGKFHTYEPYLKDSIDYYKYKL